MQGCMCYKYYLKIFFSIFKIKFIYIKTYKNYRLIRTISSKIKQMLLKKYIRKKLNK